MRSRLWQGSVWHTRQQPLHELRHRVFYVEIDLLERKQLSRRLRIFGWNRANLLSLHDADYDILSALPEAAGDIRLSLLTIPRIAGYVFNPVSFLLARDATGRIEHVWAEVHNTWGERHVYDLPPLPGGTGYHSTATKRFYVSPFLEPDGRYDFTVKETQAGGLSFTILEPGAQGAPQFAAGLDLQPTHLTTSSLLGVLVRYPLLNLKVIAAIHCHALRLWLKGARFHRHPPQKEVIG